MIDNPNCPIVFYDYDKISDTLLYLSENLTLRFNVSLSRKDQNGDKRFFHREIVKNDHSISIRRDMTFYFSIDNYSDFNSGVLMNVYDVYFIRTLIESNVLPWFFNEGTYEISDNGEMSLTGVTQPQVYTFNNGKYLQFDPIVYKDNTELEGYGCRMTINNQEQFVDMSLDKFLTFYSLLCTDMYVLASTMLTYVKTPPYGTNSYRTSYGNNLSSGNSYFDKE